jgi:hypothetical protein
MLDAGSAGFVVMAGGRVKILMLDARYWTDGLRSKRPV